ncbi:MAG TPA: hypothetical protein VF400_14280, partial [Anaeromyxobacteraceae bacterium]
MLVRPSHRSALGACVLLLAACGPTLGSRVATTTTTPASAAPVVTIDSAQVNGDGKVVVAYRLTRDGAGVAAAAAAALAPSFTLAALSTDPVSGIAAWKSRLLTGAELAQLPPSGPGTPPDQILNDTRQPGVDVGGASEDLGAGSYRYRFGTALPPGFDPNETLRVGLFLFGTTGSVTTNVTYDFAPAGGPPAARDTVLDDRCATCHVGPQRHHGGVVGVRICLTCHTYQHA